MTDDEACEQITVKTTPTEDIAMPTCGECGGNGFGFASVEHHHACKVAAAITSIEPLLADDEHWLYLGHPARPTPEDSNA